ncbi:hypothetical protein BDV30DRAFT_218985 [Aspergillus minisclerotigenes]|uniref:Transcription factor domain-containing protein n=1 Tax=Aspergillus minisclerotigenes TaxID=656917 RepID=A0A5N6IPH2_9EURO|nr:hypothetical protein BDV30DRAFT_218985 [Aspergillus minisclerotigenes]
MAFEELGLLHALLALAAAHRAVLRPVEAKRLFLRRQVHIGLAIQCHLAAISFIDKKSAPVSDDVCISTILISLYTLTLRSELRLTDPYEPPIQWLTLTRGIRTILQQTY